MVNSARQASTGFSGGCRPGGGDSDIGISQPKTQFSQSFSDGARGIAAGQQEPVEFGKPKQAVVKRLLIG